MLGLPPSMLPEVVHALETKPKPVVIWLEFQDCAGCSESFIRSTTVMPTEVLLDFISLEYHETLMAPAGEYAEESKREAMERYKGRYILVVEGSVTPNGVYCAVGGRSNAEGAGVIAVGSCASWGGIPKADPNPTGAKPVYEVLKGKKFVNIPIGFLGLTFLVPQHAFLWKEILGFELPYMPQLVADFPRLLCPSFPLCPHRPQGLQPRSEAPHGQGRILRQRPDRGGSLYGSLCEQVVGRRALRLDAEPSHALRHNPDNLHTLQQAIPLRLLLPVCLLLRVAGKARLLHLHDVRQVHEGVPHGYRHTETREHSQERPDLCRSHPQRFGGRYEHSR